MDNILPVQFESLPLRHDPASFVGACRVSFAFYFSPLCAILAAGKRVVGICRKSGYRDRGNLLTSISTCAQPVEPFLAKEL